MHKFMTTIAIAALAIGTAQAEPGNGKGNGGGNKGGGNDHAGHVMQGGQGGSNGKAMREMGNGKAKAERAAEVPAMRADRGNANGNGKAKGYGVPSDRSDDRMEWSDKGRGNDDRGKGKFDDRGDVAIITRDGDRVRRVSWGDFDSRYDRSGVLEGCPPGLAKKNNGCMPPGLAKQDEYGWDMDRDFWGLRNLRDLAGYRYYDGSLVRYGPSGSIISYYPLLGGALGIGQVWPTAYAPVAVDPYYVDYYGLGPDYRYFDGAFYTLDPETQAISAIAGLLTGDSFTVGQRMPLGYDVYNVPYAYREQYYDRPDAYYRYSDGYVYEVDPTTQLIVAAIQLLS